MANTSSQQFSKLYHELFQIKELSFVDITVYSIVNSLAAKEGYCYASNKAILEILGDKIHKSTLTRSLRVLENLNLISVECTRYENNNFYTDRKIFILPLMQIASAPEA